MACLHCQCPLCFLALSLGFSENGSAPVSQAAGCCLCGSHRFSLLFVLAPILRHPMTEAASPDPSQKSPVAMRILGIVISVMIVVAAICAAIMVFENIRINPRTEDAQVRANVIGVAPQVGGSIIAIHVKDNEVVHKGQLLLELDSRPYAAEAEKAKAQLALTELEIQAYKDQITSAEAQLRQSEAKATYAVDYAKRVQALVGNL